MSQLPVDRSNFVNQYSTSVTTGQGQYEWTNKISMGAGPQDRNQLSTRPTPGHKSTKIFAHPSELEGQVIQSGAIDFEGCHNAVYTTTRKSSDSMESMQHHVPGFDHAVSEPESLTLSESEESADEEGLKREPGSRVKMGPSHCLLVQSSKEKKKVGRPIAYRGDPDSPDLTEVEKRRIKRRIANRESARRVRYKRQELVDDLQVKIDCLQSQNAELRQRAAESKQERDELSFQLREITSKYKELQLQNSHMQLELQSLRTSLQLRMTALENDLDRQDNEPDGQEDKSLFGSVQAQSATNPGYNSQSTFPFASQGDFKGSYSFQLALDSFPSLHLGERSVDLFGTENQELPIFRNGSAKISQGSAQ